jgi:hypothetical protein
LCFVSKHFMFLWWGVVSTSLNSQASGPPILSCQELLVQYPCSCPLYLEVVSSVCNLKTCLSWWQGSSYNGYEIKYFVKLGRFSLLQWPCLWCVSLVH